MPAPVVPTLYHVSWFYSSIAVQIARELPIDDSSLKIKTISSDELRAGSLILEVSPRRVVPAIALPDGTSITEVGAIVLYMLETFDTSGKLHPLIGDVRRPRFLQAMFYVVSECYKAAFQVFLLCFRIDPKFERIDREERDEQCWKAATDKFRAVVINHLVREIGDGRRKYYLGNSLSAADFMFGYILMWVDSCDEGLLDHEVVKQYYGRLKERPLHKELYLECM